MVLHELVEPPLEVFVARAVGEVDREVVVVTGRRDHLERLALRVAVPPVRRDHVVVGGHLLEEVLLDVPDRAVVRQLEDVHVERPAVRDARRLERVQHVVAAGIAGEQHDPVALPRQAHDARQVVGRLVEVLRDLRVALLLLAHPRHLLGPLLAQALDLVRSRRHDVQARVVVQFDGLPSASRRLDEPVEGGVQGPVEPLGVRAQVLALRHARDHGLGVLRLLRGRRHLLGPLRVVRQVVERVVPERLRAQPGRPRALILGDQLFGELQQSADVVVVDVADHQQLERQRLVVAEPPERAKPLAELEQPRLERVAVDRARPAVDQDERRALLGPEVEQQAVAMTGAECLEREGHGYTAWIARSTSTMPAPWKARSRPRSVQDFIRISFTRSGLPISSGWRAISSAHAPDTCGAAWLVPSLLWRPTSGTGAVIRSPGATRSGVAPAAYLSTSWRIEKDRFTPWIAVRSERLFRWRTNCMAESTWNSSLSPASSNTRRSYSSMSGHIPCTS